MDTVNNLRTLPATRFTGADLRAALDPADHDAIVDAATRDVAAELDALGIDSANLPAQHRDRIIATRAMWRALVLEDRSASARELGHDFERQLDALLLREESLPPSKKRRAAH